MNPEKYHADGFAIELITGSTQESSQMAQSLQHTFAQAGIQLSIKTGTGKQILGIYRAREHDIFWVHGGRTTLIRKPMPVPLRRMMIIVMRPQWVKPWRGAMPGLFQR